MFEALIDRLERDPDSTWRTARFVAAPLGAAAGVRGEGQRRRDVDPTLGIRRSALELDLTTD